ncbi:allophanate hydrolase subunit 1 [Nocardioides sp. W7]|uniref:5-oxoprolinase subunit B family protein n=1 Tax=Nocardioides sp. W7 TaxID=2931390 RepID=UPI001FD0F6DD|nr:allophanate hydrolase subunit 1 [Nocardioides sp. W7]
MTPAPTLLPYGDRAVLVELGSTERALAWADALEADRPAGVADVVPAAETVLVVLAEDAPVDRVREALRAVRPAAQDRGAPGTVTVEIPVVYDGPDLADVARLTRLSEAEVVAAHTGTSWRVAFGGFAPGFGYLVGGDPRLRVPRRDRARTTVPTGSVGLAGEFSGVYPRPSPGGWQLIGRTEVRLWDLDRDPPALLQRGAEVRFTEAGS